MMKILAHNRANTHTMAMMWNGKYGHTSALRLRRGRSQRVSAWRLDSTQVRDMSREKCSWRGAILYHKPRLWGSVPHNSSGGLTRPRCVDRHNHGPWKSRRTAQCCQSNTSALAHPNFSWNLVSLPGKRHTAQSGRVSRIGSSNADGWLVRASEAMRKADRTRIRRMLCRGPNYAVLVSKGYAAVTSFGASRVRKVGRKSRSEEVDYLRQWRVDDQVQGRERSFRIPSTRPGAVARSASGRQAGWQAKAKLCDADPQRTEEGGVYFGANGGAVCPPGVGCGGSGGSGRPRRRERLET